MEAKRRVLVVDDDVDIRETLADALEVSGFDVLTSANGAEALERLRRDGLPCIILLDLMMPVMDGFAFWSHQQQDPELAKIPVIVISAGGRPAPNTIAASDFLAKPFKLPRLLAAIEKHCA